VPEEEGAVAVSGEVETADVPREVETPDVVAPDGPGAEWWSEYTMATAATTTHASTTVAATTRLRSLGPPPLRVLR
jgi:hypothetical protein